MTCIDFAESSFTLPRRSPWITSSPLHVGESSSFPTPSVIGGRILLCTPPHEILFPPSSPPWSGVCLPFSLHTWVRIVFFTEAPLHVADSPPHISTPPLSSSIVLSRNVHIFTFEDADASSVGNPSLGMPLATSWSVPFKSSNLLGDLFPCRGRWIFGVSPPPSNFPQKLFFSFFSAGKLSICSHFPLYTVRSELRNLPSAFPEVNAHLPLSPMS